MDDSELALACWPPLTSVDLGSEERGRIAAEMLLERLAGVGLDGTPARRTTATPRLVVRGSSSPAAHAPTAPHTPSASSIPAAPSASSNLAAPSASSTPAALSGHAERAGQTVAREVTA